MSSISIIGTGSMARALAGRALAGGNAVEIIGRNTDRPTDLAGAVGGATVGTTGAAPMGDIVVLAVPYASAAAVISRYGEALRGKVVVDVTNPITPDLTGFLTPEGTFGARESRWSSPRACMSSRRSTRCPPTSWRPARPRGAHWTCSSPATMPRPRRL